MAHVLVIDDEELARFAMREILESKGHTVSEAENGEDGLAVFKAAPADLVITDIIMPRKEGIETIKDLKDLAPGLPVVAVSGGGRTRNLDFLALARDYGAEEVVVKPFTDDELIQAVDAALAAVKA